MQTSVVRPHVLALRAGLVLMAALMSGGAWAQATQGDAAKVDEEQAVVVAADKTADAEPKAAGSDTKQADGEQASEPPAPASTVTSEEAKPAPADAKQEAAEPPAAPSNAAVQAPATVKDTATDDKAAAETPKTAETPKAPAVTPAIKPAASDVTPHGAPSDASKSAAPADTAAAPRPAEQGKPDAKQAAGSSGHREHHGDGARRRSRAVESPEGKSRHKGVCQNFRTYNAERGTYRGYDGRVHRCS